jgi:Tfp pilus assembly protein PilN
MDIFAVFFILAILLWCLYLQDEIDRQKLKNMDLDCKITDMRREIWDLQESKRDRDDR